MYAVAVATYPNKITALTSEGSHITWDKGSPIAFVYDSDGRPLDAFTIAAVAGYNPRPLRMLDFTEALAEYAGAYLQVA